MTTLRKINRMAMPDIVPGGADMAEPVLKRARPEDLMVDDAYQRNLSERSVTLIRKMVSKWDWRSFQPPLCVETPTGYHVVDGQHTAIAAATHPAISTIPILVIDATEVTHRAQAFLGRNRDRIIVTPNQLHYAAVAAGDPVAATIDRVCRDAGVRILKNRPGADYYTPGDTLAIGAVEKVVKRHGEATARKIMKVCGAAKLAPLSANYIRAVEHLITSPEFSGRVPDPADIVTAIRAGGAGHLEIQARIDGAAKEITAWKCLAVIIYKKVPRGSVR